MIVTVFLFISSSNNINQLNYLDMDCVHKIQLQNNAPMNNLDPPVFELPPANDFKATELANGCSIECPSSSNTIKETEGAFDLMSLSSDIFDKASILF